MEQKNRNSANKTRDVNRQTDKGDWGAQRINTQRKYRVQVKQKQSFQGKTLINELKVLTTGPKSSFISFSNEGYYRTCHASTDCAIGFNVNDVVDQ